MFSIKKLALSLTTLMMGGSVLGHQAALLKEELMIIDSFVKELRCEHTDQAQKLVSYLEKVLNNDCGGHYGDPEYRHIPDEEVLKIDRILTSDVSFEEKRAGILNIMLEEYAKDTKEKAERKKREMYSNIMAGCVFASYILCGYYCLSKPLSRPVATDRMKEFDAMLQNFAQEYGLKKKANNSKG